MGSIKKSAQPFDRVDELIGETLVWHLECDTFDVMHLEGEQQPYIWGYKGFKDVDSSGDQLLASFVGPLLDWSPLGDPYLVSPSWCLLILFFLVHSFELSLYFFGYFVFFLHEIVFQLNFFLLILKKKE